VGAFGVIGWVSAVEYNRSAADPLADTMPEIIQHMNADHKDALVLLARKFAGIESQEATMTMVDRLGFQVRLKTQDGMRGVRIAFLREVTNSAETRKVLVEMVQQGASAASCVTGRCSPSSEFIHGAEHSHQSVQMTRSSSGANRRSPESVDFGTGPNRKFADTKQCVFSAAAGKWRGFWHSRSDRKAMLQGFHCRLAITRGVS
jgi:hypothetical protein